MISRLIAIWWHELKGRLSEVISCVTSRNITQHEEKDDRSLLLGWLIPSWLACIDSETDTDVLVIHLENYFLLRHRTSILVIKLYQNQDFTLRTALLEKMLKQEVPGLVD